jgi:hypothetical protein
MSGDGTNVSSAAAIVRLNSQTVAPDTFMSAMVRDILMLAVRLNRSFVEFSCPNSFLSP